MLRYLCFLLFNELPGRSAIFLDQMLKLFPGRP
jgi:hypothetical protein